MSFALSGWTSGFSHARPPTDNHLFVEVLSWALVPLQRPPKHRAAAKTVGVTQQLWTAPSVRFRSPSAFFHLGQRHEMIGLGAPDRLHLQVVSTSWCFHPPQGYWPCFMPDPLLGTPFRAFPFRAAVRRLRRVYPLDVSTSTGFCSTRKSVT